MNEATKQLTTELAAQVKAYVESPEVAAFIEKTKASGDDRTFEVVMSTADEDRQGDGLDQSKWEFKYYNLNPVVLWAHNYQGFPIGIVTDIEIKGNETVATGKFSPEGVNPEADMACALYQEKILRAVSPGYIQNDDGTRELLEMSFCPVPAGRYALSLRQVGKLGVSTRELIAKGFFFENKGAVPFKSHGTADPDTAWDGPAEVKACGDDLDKLKSICAWYDSENADVKSAYKLPHHHASDLKAVWKGVAAAGAALQGGRGGVDIPESDVAGVKAHLAKHYAEFGKTPPWEKKAEQLGDRCELDDGTPGILSEDPDNPGHLVCVPEGGDKGHKSNENDGDMNNELTKKLKAEHDRHQEAFAKHIDEFGEKALPEDGEKAAGNDNSEYEKALDEFTEKMDGEQADHLEKCMKAIDDSYALEDQKPKKSIDEFKAAFNAEHEKHVKAFHKAIDEFKSADGDGEPEACKKALDEFTEKAETELDRHEKAHMDLCEAEMGQGENDEAKALTDAIMKAGRAISAANKEKIKTVIKSLEDLHDAHGKSTKDVIAALKDLAGPDEGNEGEDKPKKPDDGADDGDDDGKEGKAQKTRSRSAGAAPNADGEKLMTEFEAYMFVRKLLRTVNSETGKGLASFNKVFREKFPDRR